ncbi:hypothetical protein HHX47_DHR4000226, partial [Lentinula edodes]
MPDQFRPCIEQIRVSLEIRITPSEFCCCYLSCFFGPCPTLLHRLVLITPQSSGWLTDYIACRIYSRIDMRRLSSSPISIPQPSVYIYFLS